LLCPSFYINLKVEMILNPAWDARVPKVKPGGNQSCDLCGEDLPFQGVTSKTTPHPCPTERIATHIHPDSPLLRKSADFNLSPRCLRLRRGEKMEIPDHQGREP
jgi:hypothetical protein